MAALTPPRVLGYATRRCECGGRMAIQRCPIGHRRTLICEDCGSRRPLPLATRLRLAGHLQLPGFEEL